MNKIEQLKELKSLLDVGAINQKEYDQMKTEVLGTTYVVPDRETITVNLRTTNKIGFQIWMAENLNVSVFRNGDPITEAKSDAEWIAAGTNGKPVWCYHEDNKNNEKLFGKLYNGFALNDPRGLAPEGWHIPSDDEWNILIKIHGGEEIAAKNMKSTKGWEDDEDGNSGNGTNELGFDALPGGYRDFRSVFRPIGEYTSFWVANDDDDEFIQRINLYNSINEGSIEPGQKPSGFYVRCIKV